MSGSTGSIPISSLIGVNPEVLAAGGSQLALNGLFLTSGTRVPVGAVYSFASLAAVGAYFGTSSVEYAEAGVYFAGFTGSQTVPEAMLVAQYPVAAVPAWLRGGSVAGLTLAQLQAFTGTLALSVNGTVVTSSTITLTSAASFSAAATLIQAAFTAPAFAVTYDSTSGAFVFTTTLAGATASFAYPTTSTLATNLALTAATGAIISPGAAVAVPAAFMSAVTQVTQNWATFTTMFNPDGTSGLNVVKQAFQAWNNVQNNRYAYIAWDTDIVATEQGTTTSLGYLLKQTSSSGCVVIYEPSDLYHAAFVMSYAASLDFSQENGRFTAAYRTQSGLVPAVTTLQVATNLMANGYNFYGTYGNASSNDANIFYPGSVTGEFLWFDSYVNQIWLNNNMQIALFTLLQTVGTVPYNAYGYNLIMQALIGDKPGSTGAGPINQAVWYGAIVAGVALSSTQILDINAQAGAKAATVLQSQGWYLQVGNATAAQRVARSSPPITLWYLDGQSVQSISMNSVEVQ
jgi:hypothetical protein